MVHNKATTPDSSSPKPDRKAQILALLEEQDGWVSGEDIAAGLGISRAATAKHIQALRREGHAIAAATRRGYRLLAKAEPLDQAAVTAALRTNFLGRAGWRFLPETSSTNNEAMLWAAQGGPAGAVVVAERQAQGRGRKGQAWVSTPRGLEFSFILRPDLSAFGTVDQLAQLTALAAKAVATAVTNLTKLTAVYKAPNDVLVNNRKVCGVLLELGFRAEELDWAVLGIGCNVNALPNELPEPDRITSLLAESGAPLSRARLLAGILNEFESMYEYLREGTRG